MSMKREEKSLVELCSSQ